MNSQKTQRRCLIMMTLYNGKFFLAEQLQSILDQSYPYWDLIAQDDGSTDGTETVFTSFASMDERFHFCTNESNNHGPYQNFNVLINRCRKLDQKYDFYLFADQDDVWDQDKLDRLIAFYDQQCEALKIDDSCPVFIQGNMRVIDKDGKVVIPDLDAEDHIRRDGVSIYFDAATWGCNTIMNRSMFEDIKPVPDDAKRVWGHDQYFARWACIRGRFLYDLEICFSYRRYSQSVTGDHDLQVTKKRVMSRLAKVDELAFDHAISYKSALFVLDQLEKVDLTDKQQAQVTQLRMVINRGGLRAFVYWKQQKIDLGRRVRSLSHLGILTLGMYKRHLEKIV